MFYILIFLVFILIFLDYIIHNTKYALVLKKIPGGKYYFLIGNTLELLDTRDGLFSRARQWAKQYDGIYRLYAFTTGAVNIYTPEDIEVVISSMKHHEKSDVYTFLRPWLKDGLLLSDGQKWQQRRKILTNAFHFNVLRKYFVMLEGSSQRLVESLYKRSGEAVSIVPIISDYTLNSICESAMGTQINKGSISKGKSYKDAIRGIVDVLSYRFVRIYLHPKIIFDLTPLRFQQTKFLNIMHKFTEDVIKNRKEAIRNNEVQNIDLEEDTIDDTQVPSKKKKVAMLDLLIAAEKEGSIDKVGIREEVDTFMFEGHDTTSSGLTYNVLLIANNPKIQENIVTELRSIFGGTSRATTLEDLNKMQYLERCIKESLRLYPPVPFIGRKLSEDAKLSNYTVPAGTLCHIHIYDLHHHPDLYENPHVFDPDRFLPENCIKRHNFAYLPFSAGPRNCIGQKFAMMEMKLAIAAILRNFELHPVTTPNDLKFTIDLVLRNADPIYVKFVKRNNVI